MGLMMALALVQAGAAQDCQAVYGPWHDGPDVEALPNQVDGGTVGGVEGLVRLRAARGTAPIIINGGNFARADFRGVRLPNICFVRSDLSGSDWRGAEAAGTGFIDANLEGANLVGARLPRVLLRQPNLKDVDATGADLSGGRMDGGWDGSVESLRLDRANLSGFRFECGITISDGCPLQGEMSLSGANLTGASLATYFRFDGWGGTRIDRTELGLHQLAEIGSSDIRGPILLRGGDARIEISPAEYRELLPHLREPWQLSEAAAPNAPPAWAVPGSIALFVDTPTYFDAPFRATRLYARLLPALVGAAYSRVAVRVNRDGSIDAGGEAIGGNAHLCNLAGEGLRFDPSSGWYSGPFDARPEDPPEWSRGQIPVLKMVGDGAEVYRAGVGIAPEDPRPSQYASCGARATFLPMVRIAGHEEEARRLMEDAGRP